jgi:hypothetical protein
MTEPQPKKRKPLRRAIDALGLVALIAWGAYLFWAPTQVAERRPAGRIIEIRLGPSAAPLFLAGKFAPLSVPGSATAITTKGPYKLVGPGQLRVGDEVTLQRRKTGDQLLCAGKRCAELENLLKPHGSTK